MYCVYPHGIRSFRDVLKLGYFVLTKLTEPFAIAMRMATWVDRLSALPVAYISRVAWKSGMLAQAWSSSFLLSF